MCAEWEFGGYPSWLLKDRTMVIRSSDAKYMQPATRWIKRLGQELAPLQIGNGGPIVLVQVENEYGSFGDDHAYMEQNRQTLVDAGFTKAQMYTADGPDDIANGSLPQLPVGINFDGNRVNQAEKSFATLKAKRPDGPMFNSEFWAGWFDHWGGKHAHTDATIQAANLDWMLSRGYSVSIYMFHGGTDFGWMNGANSSDSKKDYEPDVTSYDYDAALDESGRPTAKFFAFRDVIAKATGVVPPAVPEVAAPIAIPAVELKQTALLWRNLPERARTDQTLTMEDLDQGYGFILYRTFSTDAGDFDLILDSPHGYAHIYLNEQFVGTLDRRLDQNHLSIHIPAARSRLDILVENTGRINYSHQLRGEREGITKQATLAGRPIADWQIYSLPMANPSSEHLQAAGCSGPCFYRGTFHVDQIGDTFLDTSQLTKGQIWVNGHALGRFWNIGPQKTLYLPGPWLKKGANEVIVFDVDGHLTPKLEGLTTANLGE